MTVTVENAKIVGTLKVDISGETADKLVLNGAADVSGLTVDFGSVKPTLKVLQVLAGTGLTGTDKLTLKNVPQGFLARASASGVKLMKPGLAVSVR